MDNHSETRAKLEKILAKVDELIPPVETVRLKPSRGSTTVFDSKLGGVPYFPKDMEYPTVCEGVFTGRPLKFLAQLNFALLPKLEGFPTEGILQFFAGCIDDTVYGANFDNGCDQNGFRVIYHENVIDDFTRLISDDDMPKFDGGDDYYPFTGEFLLIAEPLEKMSVTGNDFRGEKAVAKAYSELFGGDIKGIFDLMNADPELADVVFDICVAGGTRMGGYPIFTQEDPRGYRNDYYRHTILLFQSDSESGGEGWENEVCWGDAGVANFFIAPEDLAKRDFSHVLYTWDCG